MSTHTTCAKRCIIKWWPFCGHISPGHNVYNRTYRQDRRFQRNWKSAKQRSHAYVFLVIRPLDSDLILYAQGDKMKSMHPQQCHKFYSHTLLAITSVQQSCKVKSDVITCLVSLVMYIARENPPLILTSCGDCTRNQKLP